MDKLFKGRTKGNGVLWNDGYAFDVVKKNQMRLRLLRVYDGKEAEK